MNILHITAQKPSSTGSGIYLTQLAHAIEGLAVSGRQGVLAGVYTEDIAQLEAEFGGSIPLYPVIFESEELPFHIFGMSDVMPYRSALYRSMTAEQLTSFSRAFLEKADEAAADLRPDVILCHHLYLLTALIRRHFPDIPVYAFCHNTDLTQFLSHDLAHELILGELHRLDGVFVLHEAQRRKVTEVLGISPDKIHTAGAGYDPAVFCREGSGEHDPSQPTKIVFAGKLTAAKGVPSLIRALTVVRDLTRDRTGRLSRGHSETADQHPDCTLTLAGSAGDPSEEAEIRRLADRAPYPVVLAGSLPQKKLADLYRRSDIFVLPSFNEGLPLCVIEALACGLRVVMTDLPGIRGWIETNAPDAAVSFIPLPLKAAQQILSRGTCDPDSLTEEDLFDFETGLGEAIAAAAWGPDENSGKADLSGLTWQALAGRVLAVIGTG